MTSVPDGVDPVPLDKIREAGGNAMADKVIGIFLEHAPQRLATARAAGESGDADALERAMHSLKSSAAQVGAARLSLLCRELETRARERQLTGIATLLDRADQAFQSFREWVSPHRPPD